jgi:hypothetical protein
MEIVLEINETLCTGLKSSKPQVTGPWSSYGSILSVEATAIHDISIHTLSPN